MPQKAERRNKMIKCKDRRHCSAGPENDQRVCGQRHALVPDDGFAKGEPQAPEQVETESHSEAAIFEGCIALMQGLTEHFREYLESLDIDLDGLDEEELFSVSYTPFEIVQRLFLWETRHSGGTSTRKKCAELGIKDATKSIYFEIKGE